MATRVQQSASVPVQLAIDEGDTTPDPGRANSIAYSTIHNTHMRWNGTSWTRADPSSPAVINFLEVYGHSYVQQPVGMGTGFTNITPDQSGEMDVILAGALNLSPNEIRNHAMTATQLTSPGRNGSGFARLLTDIVRKRQTAPFLRGGGGYLFVYGINDAGYQGSGAAVQNQYKHALRLAISRARSSAIFLASGGANWTWGSNFTAAPATYVDWTGGAAMRATVVDSAGTSTATFKIPLGYQGEPIAFAISGANGATGGDITWGGTVTGTSGIVGTVTTTDSLGLGTNKGIVTVRFTAATNGLSKSNAGQTITLKVTRVSASGEIVIDSAWIEAFKPDAVVVGNVARPACRKIPMRVGDFATTSASTTATSAVAAFATGTDAGNAVAQVSGTAAVPAGTTISSVTNATTIVMSAAATSTQTNLVVDFDRTINGYAQYTSGNANFTNATPASHAAADADVAAFNTWISAVVAEFDTMVRIADLDGALGGGDITRPANVSTYFAWVDGLHPNELGNTRCARAIYDALVACTPVDQVDLGPLELLGSPAQLSMAVRRPRRSGQLYLPECSPVWNTANYTAVVGNMFAVPFMVTEFGESWSNAYVLQMNAPTTSGSSVRWGVYDDPSFTCYPQTLWKEPTSGAAVALGTTSGMKSLTSMGWHVRPGLYWLVLKVDVLGTTASQLAQINGPSPYLPSWQTTATTTLPSATEPWANVGWRVTGLSAGVLPNSFPTGATLVHSAPAIGVVAN